MSTLEVGKIVPATGTAVTLGESGDTLTVPSGATLAVASGATIANSGTATGFGLFSSYAIIADEKASATAGGTFTSGSWQTRDLQTEIADPDGIVSITTNAFTLAAGSYLIKWSAPAYRVNNNQTRLYDVTGTAAIQDGTPMEANSTYWGEVVSSGAARVTPSGSNVYRIEHRCGTTNATYGYGIAVGYGGGEVYTLVEIYKES